MPIRLLALDLDGTLLNSGGEVSEGNLQALKVARAAGVSIVIVTGRRFRDARPMALSLGLDLPLVSHNGALTKHAATLETIDALLMPLDAALDVIKAGRQFGADALLSDDHDGMGLLVHETLNQGNTQLGKYITWSNRINGPAVGETIRRVSSLERYLDHEPIHIAFSGRCAQMAELTEELRRSLGQRIRVLCTIYPNQDFTLVDVLNPDASKGAGVKAVTESLHLVPQDVMAIGDNHNDLEMLHFAGTGVVMANASDEMRETPVFFRTASNDEDGVALAIKRFIFEDGV